MRRILATGLVALTAGPAFAGGVERSTQSMAILFQQGRYVEFGAQYARPRVSGEAPGPLAIFGLTGATGNITRPIFFGNIAFRDDINENLSYAIILDQPIGANVRYRSDTEAFLSGSSASIDSVALTGVLRYSFGNGFSAYAGLRSVWSKGNVDLEFPVPPFSYTMETKRDQAWGYLVGVAYEMPEIAGRVSLTYNSSVKHKFTQTVNDVRLDETFETKIPESLHLEFQTGIAEDTLLSGSVRWVKWKDFNISPAGQPDLVSYDKNSVTYTLGVGRRFTENWSGSVTVGYDTGNGRTTGNLQPVSHRSFIGLGASYSIDSLTVSGGIQYSRFGKATSRAPINGEFSGNSMWGGGIRIGYQF